MTDLKKIFTKVIFLLFEFIQLTIRIIGHIVLPNRKRKGNILSSVFVFFVGTVEILNRFEHGIFQMTKILRNRNIRRGIIILGAFLFLLSSYEWIKREEIYASSLHDYKVPLQQTVFKNISVNKETKATDCLKNTRIALSLLANNCLLPSISGYSTSVKRYLLIHSILI